MPIIRNSLRNLRKSLVAIIAITLVAVFIMFYSDSLAKCKADLAALYRDTVLDAEVLAESTTSALKLEAALVDAICDLRCVQDCSLMAEFCIDNRKTIRALNDEAIDPSFGERLESAEWVHGGRDSFYTDEASLLLPRNMWLEPGDTVELPVRQGGSDIEFKVIGVYGDPLANPSNGQILYCSLAAFDKLRAEEGIELTYSAMSFRLIDLKHLDEFKEEAEKLLGQTENARLNIRDLQFRSQVFGMERRIKYMQIFFPLVFTIILMLSFVLSFILFKDRRNEIVLMRTLGVSSSKIFMGFFAELVIHALAGCLLGIISHRLISVSSQANIGHVLIVFFAYIAGGSLSLLRMINSNTFIETRKRE